MSDDPGQNTIRIIAVCLLLAIASMAGCSFHTMPLDAQARSAASIACVRAIPLRTDCAAFMNGRAG